jgi:hypothetical protein
MFARYASAPNALGYCGPPLGATLRNGSEQQVRAAATKFSGAWPYLRVLAAATGIDDPLDYRLVESYWLGGGVGADLDGADFLAALLAIIGPQAGRYWSHLTADLAAEAAANHCFHVFGVYPWSRLLGPSKHSEQPLHILDSCRINWGTVLSRNGNQVEVSCARLVFDGRCLALSDPLQRRLDVQVDGYSALPDAVPGDDVAMHWDRLCGRLDAAQLQALADSTARQLQLTNQRLAPESAYDGGLGTASPGSTV